MPKLLPQPYLARPVTEITIFWQVSKYKKDLIQACCSKKFLNCVTGES